MSRKVTDISAERLAELHCGQVETTTLVESFAIDFSELMRQSLPQVPQPVLRQMRDAAARGIVARMRYAATLLLETCGTPAVSRLALHPSDIVRGWVCYMISLQPELTLAQRLADIRPLADDSHFGVREWAWLALRPHIVDQPEQALALLTPWTAETSASLRRYACEALRPRGVWCTHIALFKQQPQQALPLLQALHADEARYVQDSVANWLNDAAKTCPQWVRQVCADWRQRSTSPATAYICKRALRSVT